MTEYFHDIKNRSVLCVLNCTPVFTQLQKDGGLVVITPEIYEYLLVQYDQVSVPFNLKTMESERDNLKT